MKRLMSLILSIVVWSMPTVLTAQDYEYHPFLSDRFTVSLGAMRSSDVFKISAEDFADGSSTDVDFGDNLGVSRHSTFFNGQLRWKFGNNQRWSIWGQYFGNNAKGNKTLDEDVDWDGVIFKKGSYAEAGIKLTVARLLLGYSLFKNDRNDFGIGAGIHNLDLSSYIEGEIITDDGTTGQRRAEVGANQILPNVGIWYNFSPARRWLLHARLDWIGASIGDYDGDMWNATAGVNFQAFRHVGFELYWQYFNLDVNVNKDDWLGDVDLTYSGPVVAITAAW